jgi:hypothetical protein
MPVEFVRRLLNGRHQRVGNLVEVDRENTVFVETRLDESVDVFIQDQNSPIVNVLMHQDLSTITLAANTVVNSRNIVLQAGHGVSPGELIYLRQASNFCQAIVTSVAVNTITLDTPVGCIFTPLAIAVRANADLSVNGSVAPVTFHLQPPPAVPAWDIMRLSLTITDNVAMDDGTFGGLAALTNGALLRKKNSDGTYTNIGNAKTNGQLRLFCESGEYATRAPAGEFGFSVKCVFQPSAGVVVRLDPSLNEELEILVQDDLTALLSMTAVAQGHEVVD